MKTRAADNAVERMVAQRIDAWHEAKGHRTERVYDRERQFKGVDLVWNVGGKNLNVDEKAKYWGLQDGKRLDNYSFEVSRLCDDGERRVGWFADPRSVTHYYCWAFPIFVDLRNPAGGIRPNMRVEMFAKKDVQAIVAREIELNELERLAVDMAERDVRLTPFKDFVLYKTPADKLEEEPVNVLIKRKLITETEHFITFTA